MWSVCANIFCFVTWSLLELHFYWNKCIWNMTQKPPQLVEVEVWRPTFHAGTVRYCQRLGKLEKPVVGPVQKGQFRDYKELQRPGACGGTAEVDWEREDGACLWVRVYLERRNQKRLTFTSQTLDLDVFSPGRRGADGSAPGGWKSSRVDCFFHKLQVVLANETIDTDWIYTLTVE